MKTYFGLSEDSEFLKWDYNRLIEEITGELILSIGRGEFKTQVRSSIQMAAAWAIYQDTKNPKK